MLLEKEILVWKNDCGLTTDMLDVRKLQQTDFPKLIFQDFMNQLKLPKLKIGFELNTNQLIELEPQELENVDDTIRFNFLRKNTLNLNDILIYYLLTKVLHCDFKLANIYTNNHSKSKLYFENLMPFSSSKQTGLKFIKSILKKMKAKDIQYVLERILILLGDQYKEKLILFLTYLEQKYKFKLDKNKFIESTLGKANLINVEKHLKQLL